MQKTIIIFALSILIPLSSFGQYFEIGILGGGSNYIGDLSNNSSKIFLKESHLAGGLFIGYTPGDFLSFKLGGLYTNLSGADANATTVKILERNLSFSTTIIEVSLRAEWNIGGFAPYNNTDPFAPFVYAGFSGSFFNPKTTYQGNEIELRDLGTEGQGLPGRSKKYGKVAFSVPFGLGVKYAIRENLTLGFEAGARLVLMDYLDDVSGTYVNYDDLVAGNGLLAANLSNRTGEITGQPPIPIPTGTQRGDNKAHDWYFITGLTISYNFIDNGLMGGRKRRTKSKKGCNY